MDLELQNNDQQKVGDSVIQKKSSKFKDFFRKNKLAVIVTSGVLVLALIAAGIGFYQLRHTHKSTTSSNTAATTDDSTPAAPTQTLYPNVIDGVMANQENANRHPLAVIVENHVDARPQSGLDKASLVYEAIAEGGITRFLAIFSRNESDKVGPVRSIRTYFVDLAHGLNAYLGHVGGNIDALDKIRAEKSYDLDQFAYTMPYWREYSAGLALEHTMYASTTKLREQANKNGYPTTNSFASYKFKDDPAANLLPDSQKVTINYSNASYNVYFQYNKSTNSYDRFLAGKPHTDKINKTQLSPKNLVIMTMTATPGQTRIHEQGYTMGTTGTGRAQIFINGKEVVGTWRKNSASERETFYDSTGQEIVFNRGQFWISIVSPDVKPIVQ